MFNIFKPYRLGFLLVGVYLLVAVPCAFMHWYEYSIPAMIVYWLSLPAVFVVRGLRLLPFLRMGIPLDIAWFWRSLLILCQSLIYFLLAEGLSYLVRKMRDEVDRGDLADELR